MNMFSGTLLLLFLVSENLLAFNPDNPEHIEVFRATIRHASETLPRGEMPKKNARVLVIEGGEFIGLQHYKLYSVLFAELDRPAFVFGNTVLYSPEFNYAVAFSDLAELKLLVEFLMFQKLRTSRQNKELVDKLSSTGFYEQFQIDMKMIWQRVKHEGFPIAWAMQLIEITNCAQLVL